MTILWLCSAIKRNDEPFLSYLVRVACVVSLILSDAIPDSIQEVDTFDNVWTGLIMKVGMKVNGPTIASYRSLVVRAYDVI